MSEQPLSGQPTSSASAQYQQQIASAAYANQQYAHQYAQQYAAVQQQQQQAAHQHQHQAQPYAGYGPHLRPFWEQQKQEVSQVGRDPAEFKNHQLPLARIKKIMKSDEDVRMISAEAPVMFAKACEMFILELTLKGWVHSEENRRRTLQRSDIATAIQKTEIYDFLADVIPAEEANPPTEAEVAAAAAAAAAPAATAGVAPGAGMAAQAMYGYANAYGAPAAAVVPDGGMMYQQQQWQALAAPGQQQGDGTDGVN